MNDQQVESFRKMAAQLEALHNEMSALSKRAADKTVSPFKVKYVNIVLEEAREVLADSAPNIGFLEFDPDDLPTYSDVSLIVAQFVECAEKVRCENISKHYNGAWYWLVNRQLSDIVTTPPRGGR